MASSRIAIAALALTAGLAHAQTGIYSNSIVGEYTVTQDTGHTIELILKNFPWPQLPEHADTGNGQRGHMLGYNICNETTAGPDSECMTGYLNSIDDFCLWGAPSPNQDVGVVEARMVAFCTKKGHGARLLPEGAIQGIQFMRTPDYIEVVGYIDQTALNLQANDTGGEEDPHGADGRGNPLGALMYSNAFNATNPGNVEGMTQIHQWTYFIGNGVFCFKVCDPNGPANNAGELCQHEYDEIGCTFNDPASYKKINGTFQACEGDNQLPVGVFVSAGITTTYIQNSETPPPYVASIPPSSNCQQFQSADLFQHNNVGPAGTTATPTGAVVGANPTGSSGVATPASTGTSSPASTGVPSNQNDASSAFRAGAGFGAGGWAAAVTLSAAVCGLALL